MDLIGDDGERTLVLYRPVADMPHGGLRGTSFPVYLHQFCSSRRGRIWTSRRRTPPPSPPCRPPHRAARVPLSNTELGIQRRFLARCAALEAAAVCVVPPRSAAAAASHGWIIAGHLVLSINRGECLGDGAVLEVRMRPPGFVHALVLGMPPGERGAAAAGDRVRRMAAPVPRVAGGQLMTRPNLTEVQMGSLLLQQQDSAPLTDVEREMQEQFLVAVAREGGRTSRR